MFIKTQNQTIKNKIVIYLCFFYKFQAPSKHLKQLSDFLGLERSHQFLDQVIVMTEFEKMKSGIGKPQELLNKLHAFSKGNGLHIFRKGQLMK